MHQITRYTVFVNIFVPVVLFELLRRAAALPAAAPCNCTPLSTARTQFRNSVLIRRSRTTLFPKNAFVLITPAFTKAIIDGRPSGLSYSIEFDMYTPLPDTIEAWQPTLLVNKVKQAQAKEPVKEKLPANTENYTTETPTAPWATSWPDTFPADALQPVSTYAEDDMWSDFWPSDTDNRYELPVETAPHFVLPQLDKACDFNGRRMLQDYCRRNDQRYRSNTQSTVAQQFHKIPKLAPMLIDKANKRYDYSYQEKWAENGPKSYNSKFVDKSEETPMWKYHHSYRERREIFEQLEVVGKIFKFNMKACIQRAMCEVVTHVKPYGESLIEDILRILLTLPTNIQVDDDDYRPPASRAHRGVSCASQFTVSCPYPVLEVITRNMRNYGLKHKATMH